MPRPLTKLEPLYRCQSRNFSQSCSGRQRGVGFCPLSTCQAWPEPIANWPVPIHSCDVVAANVHRSHGAFSSFVESTRECAVSCRRNSGGSKRHIVGGAGAGLAVPSCYRRRRDSGQTRIERNVFGNAEVTGSTRNASRLHRREPGVHFAASPTKIAARPPTFHSRYFLLMHSSWTSCPRHAVQGHFFGSGTPA
ncbi:hypothetical protein L1887_58195 [Cichorium endivia]|nr:hypothetical protein L1887_58195 [Cichorium endivia]